MHSETDSWHNKFTPAARAELRTLALTHASDQLNEFLTISEELANNRPVVISTLADLSKSITANTDICYRGLLMEVTGTVSMSDEFRGKRGVGALMVPELGSPGKRFIIDSSHANDLGRFLRRSCLPNCFASAYVNKRGNLGVFIAANFEIPVGQECSVPFDADFAEQTEQLECIHHRGNPHECPMEIKRLEAVQKAMAAQKKREEDEQKRKEASLEAKKKAGGEGKGSGGEKARPVTPERLIEYIHEALYFPDIAPESRQRRVRRKPAPEQKPDTNSWCAGTRKLSTTAHWNALLQSEETQRQKWINEIVAKTSQRPQSARHVAITMPKRSCVPNCVLHAPTVYDDPTLTVKKAIGEGEEITIAFDEDYIDAKNPLLCHEHRNNPDACPLEIKRRAKIAEKLEKERQISVESGLRIVQLDEQLRQVEEERRLLAAEREQLKRDMQKSISQMIRDDVESD